MSADEIRAWFYMDASIEQLRGEGFKVRDEDIARLSPLGFEHINMLGRYTFTLPAAVADGALRPLRDPGAATLDIDCGALTEVFRSVAIRPRGAT